MLLDELLVFDVPTGVELLPPVAKLEKELLLFPAVGGVCGVDGAPKLLVVGGVCGDDGAPNVFVAAGGVCCVDGVPKLLVAAACGVCGADGAPKLFTGGFDDDAFPLVAKVENESVFAVGVDGDEGAPKLLFAFPFVAGVVGAPKFEAGVARCVEK